MSKPAAKHTAPARPATHTYRISWREAVDAAMRLRTDHRGRRYVNRFTTAKVIEHFVAMLTFTILAITGFTQAYYETTLGKNVLALFGGIAAVRQVHHAFAFILGFIFFYHIFNYLNDVFVYRRAGKMWLTRSELALLLKLGVSKQPLRFDRYTLAEKVSYWVLMICIVTLGLTGIVQAYPIMATRIFPGTIIPLAKIFHHWEAILAVLAVVVWHLYDVAIRRFNVSIFTGNMPIQHMEADHPLELQYLELAAAAAHHTKWPVTIEVQQEAPVTEAEAGAPVPEETPEVEEQAERPAEEAQQNHSANEEQQ